MRTRTLVPCLLLATLLAPMALASTKPASKPQDPRPPAPILRGGECLDPRMARGFTPVNDRVLLVDAGRFRYRIEVSPACWNLDYTPVISFRGDPIGNRVCGSAFDAVLVRNSNPCLIRRMELLSKDEYKLAIQQYDEQRKARRAAKKSGKP